MKKTIKEVMFIEELKTLLSGGEIEFYQDDNIILKISGKDFKDHFLFKRFLEELNFDDDRISLREDILNRYDNEEYWDFEILEDDNVGDE